MKKLIVTIQPFFSFAVVSVVFRNVLRIFGFPPRMKPITGLVFERESVNPDLWTHEPLEKQQFQR
ncbi:MAG TPA: hypothetical protein ENN66_02475 [Proteobacteria bacterium]|nr:hypothetical protein [Pseudomonadota bacterium]